MVLRSLEISLLIRSLVNINPEAVAILAMQDTAIRPAYMYAERLATYLVESIPSVLQNRPRCLRPRVLVRSRRRGRSGSVPSSLTRLPSAGLALLLLL